MNACTLAGRRPGRWSLWIALGLAVGVAGAALAQTEPKKQEEKPAAAKPAKDLPKAEDLLNKMVEAAGGKAFDKLRNRLSKGTFEVVAQGIKGEFVLYEEAPNKMRSTIQLGGMGKVESGADGKTYWEVSPMAGPRILEGDERVATERQTTFNGLVQWKKLYKKAETIGEEVVDGQPAWKLTMTPAEGGPETWFLDQGNHLIVRLDMKMKTPMAELPIESYFTDYKKVDDVLLPHRVRQKVMTVEQVMTLDTISHNVEISKGTFDIPAEIEALAKQPKDQKAPPPTPGEKKDKGKDKP